VAGLPLVLRLGDERCRQPALAGGKGASLARLVQAGFSVPAGTVVTTAAYAGFVADLAGEIAATLAGVAPGDRAGAEAAAAAIRARIEARPLPGETATAIAAAYASLADTEPGAPPPFVAVRSSGTAEDLAGASFAGMHDTFLDVRGAEAVVDTVRRCWASLWTARAIAYRQARPAAGTDADRGPLLAVVLQRMVDAEVAGVLFTANPLTGSRAEFVINAAWGLGEGVVSGIVTPDEFVVDRATLACTVVRSPEGAGTVELETPAERAAAFCLDGEQIARLGALGRELEAHAGGVPQDIEWAIEHGHVHLLQSRPITGPGFDAA
jgi:rifampicin phosphotransferase